MRASLWSYVVSSSQEGLLLGIGRVFLIMGKAVGVPGKTTVVFLPHGVYDIRE
jgi:hypothetical protein